MSPRRSREPETTVGPLGWLGCGCGCFSGLLIVGALLAIMAFYLEALLWEHTYVTSGGALCVGIAGLIVGVVLYIMGLQRG